ncbi:EthD domain-containing protein [Maritimibacter sp. UBA3975]|uniref:EthD domain-containing protein n=1 Tax=Maritimibacter sp. UBA3975 TaxID=1946833 RepID=UPI000C090CDB|nr:EthD domain-containing protein [Maritimibacter sp. UBA3975]MAM61290.1 hypothetical protein [Maritimibacter sp.]|tara:strand:- start:1056 stop:1721 length:666 start_codon:yes stop_codon:yes gene_type:complete
MSEAKPNKRVTLIEKRSDMSDKAFHAHWSGPHAEIARDLPGLVWYIQNHVQSVLWPAGHVPTHLGIAEIAFRDPRDIFDRIDKWERVGELREDEGRFLSTRYGCWTRARGTAVMPAQRRIVVQIGRPDPDRAEAVGHQVAELAARIDTHLPCHVEECIGESPDALTDPPGWFLFVELPVAGDIADQLTADLDQLQGLGVSAVAHLVHAEAKRLPIDLSLTP